MQRIVNEIARKAEQTMGFQRGDRNARVSVSLRPACPCSCSHRSSVAGAKARGVLWYCCNGRWLVVGLVF